MKSIITFAAAVAVNIALFSAMQWSTEAAIVPRGEVSITQLPTGADLAAFASAAERTRREAVL